MSSIINPPEGYTQVSLISGGSQNSTTTGLTTVTGSGVTLDVGSYMFTYVVVHNAAATTTGSLFSVNTSDTLAFSILIARVNGDCGSGDSDNRNLYAFDQGFAFASSRATSGNRVLVDVYIVVTTAGTLVLRFASEVNGSAITVTDLKAVYRKV